MKKILFSAEGWPQKFYDDATYPPKDDGSENPNIPADAVSVTAAQWAAAGRGQLWRSPEGALTTPPLIDAPAPMPGPIILSPADLWRRATDEEAEQIEAAMNAQSARLRNLFRTAQTYQSDDPLWSVLEAAAVQLFGVERAAELLAPSA